MVGVEACGGHGHPPGSIRGVPVRERWNTGSFRSGALLTLGGSVSYVGTTILTYECMYACFYFSTLCTVAPSTAEQVVPRATASASARTPRHVAWPEQRPEQRPASNVSLQLRLAIMRSGRAQAQASDNRVGLRLHPCAMSGAGVLR